MRPMLGLMAALALAWGTVHAQVPSPVLITCPDGPSATYAVKPDYPTLKDAARDDDLIMGTMMTGLAPTLALFSGNGATTAAPIPEGTLPQLTAEQFRQVTPGNEMKWAFTQPLQGVFTLCPAERIVQFARANGMTVNGHTLVGRSANPAWVNQDPRNLTTAEWRQIIHDHVYTVVHYFATHYPGTVTQWDVINESLGDGDLYWIARAGADYRELALQAARDADPTVKLFINDAQLETLIVTPTRNDPARRNEMLALIDSLQAVGAPLDGIGIQSHLPNFYSAADAAALKNFMQQIAGKGLLVHISELDIRTNSSGELACLHNGFDTCQGEHDLAEQAQRYRMILDLCLQVPACKMLTVWGFDDGFSPNGDHDALMRNNFGWKDVWTEWINTLYNSHRAGPPPTDRHVGLVKFTSMFTSGSPAQSYSITTDRLLVSELHPCNSVQIRRGKLTANYVTLEAAESEVQVPQTCLGLSPFAINSGLLENVPAAAATLTYGGNATPLVISGGEVLDRPVLPAGSTLDYWIMLRGEIDNSDGRMKRLGVQLLAFTPGAAVPRVAGMTMDGPCSGAIHTQCGVLAPLGDGPRSIPLVPNGSFPGNGGLFESFVMPAFVEGLSKLSVSFAAGKPAGFLIYETPWLPGSSTAVPPP